MSQKLFSRVRSLIQRDVGDRGLAAGGADSLFAACPGDLEAACVSLAGESQPMLAVVTGFFIPSATPPCAETDGPLGAMFLARVLPSLGIRVALATDPFCATALEAGLRFARIQDSVPLVALPDATTALALTADEYRRRFFNQAPGLTHLLAIERVGPSHTPDSVASQPGNPPEVSWGFEREVAPFHFDRCHTMRGRDISAHMSPAHFLFEAARDSSPNLPRPVTIGIGDGGNEIGMGKIPWTKIARHIPNGHEVACRIPTDRLVVCGISNWGAYGLAAGIAHLRGVKELAGAWNVEKEREMLRVLVESGPLVDGMLGKPAISVDGLEFEDYAVPLEGLIALLQGED